jgi:hypothetical protein
VIDESWTERDLEGRSLGLIEILTWQLHGGTEENHEETARIAGVLAEIRTEHRLNTSLDSYRYANSLGDSEQSDW